MPSHRQRQRQGQPRDPCCSSPTPQPHPEKLYLGLCKPLWLPLLINEPTLVLGAPQRLEHQHPYAFTLSSATSFEASTSFCSASFAHSSRSNSTV
ncbi:hypothetical protein BHE74_00057728 [Ensete ventricosum]|nr:hypothetical protein BHE74_00057728 [Ensete ventricosum]